MMISPERIFLQKYDGKSRALPPPTFKMIACQNSTAAVVKSTQRQYKSSKGDFHKYHDEYFGICGVNECAVMKHREDD